MKIDVPLADDMASLPTVVRRAEEDGFDTLWIGETKNDVLMQCLRASLLSERISIGSGIAVAFARSPMTVAYQANDLATASRGRFVLGLGTQVRPHIERRFAMEWSHPAARMREYVRALRTIWRSWATGERLTFEGRFYRHTLMNEFFSPGPNEFGNPKIFMAAVGPEMTSVAGEVGDGLIAHAFSTPGYIAAHTLTNLERGIAKAGRTRSDVELSATATVVTGSGERQIESGRREARERIAFYGSTPAYHPVLEHHGWHHLGAELTELSKSGRADRWDLMTNLVDDEVLDGFAVVGTPEQVAAEVAVRFGPIADRVTLYSPQSGVRRELGEIAHHLAAGAS
ncbi:TIGR03617 family F420-dependent LLM class oxidoreductase [Trebonia sp.]|uniref:TIGR03617 family F420-dependent LLM class oxidoreductase n=1 Tax=Trebonia sp. TaxID=2767075 RepID=UPI002602EB59|nr:TIGR03617 family F420-dependent LLM class oxidoreductase [Trebonia sp.]